MRGPCIARGAIDFLSPLRPGPDEILIADLRSAAARREIHASKSGANVPPNRSPSGGRVIICKRDCRIKPGAGRKGAYIAGECGGERVEYELCNVRYGRRGDRTRGDHFMAISRRDAILRRPR